MKFLVDTNVISEVQHPQGDPLVKERFAEIAQDRLFTSAVVFGELTKGVGLLPKGRRRSRLENWLEQFETNFGNRILPFNRDTAKVWGEMIAARQTKGFRISVSDGQIAATAILHDLTVITRNERHFKNTGATIWNIWSRGLSD